MEICTIELGKRLCTFLLKVTSEPLDKCGSLKASYGIHFMIPINLTSEKNILPVLFECDEVADMYKYH